MPLTFAIVRRSIYRSPFWQLFHLQFHRSKNAYTISTPTQPEQLYQANERHSLLEDDHFNVNFVRISLPGEQTRKVAFWRVPVVLTDSTGSMIPVLDFPFKAWLPKPIHRIPIAHPDELLAMLRRLEQRWSYLTSQSPPLEAYQIDTEEQTDAVGLLHSASLSDSEEETLSIRTVSPPTSLFEARRLEFPPLPPSPEPHSSTHSSRPLPIPELVGSLLIENARSSEDACPITAVPFKEGDTLSVTSCFHVFEAEAIQHWLAENDSCPVCRHSITNVVTK